MTARPLRILHAIHDFLPRHQAGSELYAAALARAQSTRHHVTILCAEYDPARAHGVVTWRMHDGLPVAEIVNNWAAPRFADTYRPPALHGPLTHVLRATRPDVVHVHSLLNLSFDLPALARASGAVVVATLHDFTMVCPSGGQRVHRAERHVCHDIDTARCARCFAESPYAAQMATARLAPGPGSGRVLLRAARAVRARMPEAAAAAARGAATLVGPPRAGSTDVDRRLQAARDTFAAFDLAVAPSTAIAADLARFGLPAERMVVADYGFEPLPAVPRTPRQGGVLRVGFVGTLAWHKGAHVLLEAVRGLPLARLDVRLAGDVHVFPDYVADLRRLAEGLPVTFTGRFERADAARIYATLDVLVVPSLWPENSPLVIHEAFMAGVPVLGARVGGIPDLVTDNVSGLLFDPERPATLSAALARLLDEPALLDRLAAAAPPVRSIERDAEEWDARYCSLVADRGRRPA
jgi:glycosyltransferase involved in cell wall biosynthesis